MPAIAKIRFTNVVYEGGGKRYNDEIFEFDGHNSAILLENGGGKTVFIQTALQAIIPHIDMAERKIKDTLSLENAPAHIAIEWILDDQPRRYAVTAASLFIENNQLQSLKYTYDYTAGDVNDIESLPFVKEMEKGVKRPASRGEIGEYYARMNKQSVAAKTFSTIQEFGDYIENAYKIVPSEWRKVATINSGEGNVDEFFNRCKTTDQLLTNLLIPVVEEAIEGENTKQFVETFEKQRDHFKKNRILIDKIEQSKRVKEKIDQYVKVFASYSEEVNTFLDMKREAKTLTNYVSNRVANKREEFAYNQTAFDMLKRDEYIFAQKEMTYDWLVINEALEEHREHLSVLKERYIEKKKSHDAFAARKQNIEISRLNKNIQSIENSILSVQKSLDQEDEQLEIQDVQALLYENACWIKGHYTYELQLIEREMNQFDTKLEEIERNKSEIEDRLLDAESLEKTLMMQKSQIDAKVDLIQEEISRLSDDLFEEDQLHAPSVLVGELEERLSSMKKSQSKLKHDVETLENLSEAKARAILEGKKRLTMLREQHLKLEAKRSSFEHAKASVLELLKSDEDFNYMTAKQLYSKEESILKALEEKLEILLIDRDNLLNQEKKQYGLLQVYKDLKQFSPEPLLEKIVEELSGETSYIASGVTHLERLRDATGMSDELLFEKYPYWAMTLVCSISEKDKVLAHVASYSEEMIAMVNVLAIEELNDAINQGYEEARDSMVYPAMWKNHMSTDRFMEWQKVLVLEQNKLQTERAKLDQQWIRSEYILKEAKSFYDNFSYDDERSLIDEEKAIQETLSHEKHMLSEMENEVGDIHREIKDSTIRLKDLSSNIIDVELMYQRSVELEKVHHNYLQISQNQSGIDQQYQEASVTVRKMKAQLNELQSSFNLIKIDQQNFENERNKILALEIWTQVAEAEPIGSTSTIESLREQRQMLNMKLMGLSRDRSALVTRLSDLENQLDKERRTLEQKRREAIFEEEVIDVYYENEENQLYNTIKEISESLKGLEQEIKVAETKVTEVATRSSIIKEKCESIYQGLYTFDTAPIYVEQKLRIEKATLLDRKKKLDTENKSLQEMINQLVTLQQSLMIKDGTYNFMLSTIEPLRMSKDYFEEVDLSPERVMNQLIANLESQKKVVDVTKELVHEEQTVVVDYCHDKISDYRLKETVIQGIKNKQDYHELLMYQEKMSEVIMKIIQVAEDDKRQSDHELQTFLVHLYTYISNVTVELNAIEDKTKVEMNEITKPIFIIDIPEIMEEEAKLSLRQYIDETVSFYENESQKEGADETVLRKAIEQKLSIKSLLDAVYGERAIRVKCRKVTNDMKISGIPMSWEQSNKWSGGEKWSKNMTLFLSILNYLAEKKQYLSPRQKKQRSVILDNPFGKASSDHVLKPVFAIAEKLGFQIIALTAHAEGKFISEYFPVVYSCRLRTTTHSDKKLMTNERVLNYAYLKENAPKTIMRMTEAEQLQLF